MGIDFFVHGWNKKLHTYIWQKAEIFSFLCSHDTNFCLLPSVQEMIHKHGWLGNTCILHPTSLHLNIVSFSSFFSRFLSVSLPLPSTIFLSFQSLSFSHTPLPVPYPLLHSFHSYLSPILGASLPCVRRCLSVGLFLHIMSKSVYMHNLMHFVCICVPFTGCLLGENVWCIFVWGSWHIPCVWQYVKQSFISCVRIHKCHNVSLSHILTL